MSEEGELAVITGTRLGYHDGYRTFWLDLDYGGIAQGFGGYVLGGPFTDEVLYGILDAVGVERWEDLKGKTVWARHEGKVGWGSNTPIVEIEAPKFVPHKGAFNAKKAAERWKNAEKA